MKRLCAALLLPLVGACAASMSHQKVAGWPQLAVYEHYVPHAQMRDRCARYVGFGSLPIACAEFRLAERRCDVWYSADFPPSRAIIEHERLHCLGHDHVGETTLRDLLARHTQRLAAENASR